jgi:hypothetical protein
MTISELLVILDLARSRLLLLEAERGVDPWLSSSAGVRLERYALARDTGKTFEELLVTIAAWKVAAERAQEDPNSLYWTCVFAKRLNPFVGAEEREPHA